MKQSLKALLIIFVAFSFSAAWGCKLLVHNDTQKNVIALDFGKEGDQIQGRYTIKPDETTQVNANPEAHARVSIHVDSLVFQVHQIACSKNHKIMIKISDLLKGKYNDKVLKVTKRVAFNTVLTQPRPLMLPQVTLEEES